MSIKIFYQEKEVNHIEKRWVLTLSKYPKNKKQEESENSGCIMSSTTNQDRAGVFSKTDYENALNFYSNPKRQKQRELILGYV